MPCKICLRRDQSLSQRKIYSSDKVAVFAPSWVKEALSILADHLKGVTFEVQESECSSTNKKSETFTITEDFNGHSLITLQKIARNESCNTSGIIKKSLYPDIEDKKILYSIRDLVRQCVITGCDNAASFGGYGCHQFSQKKEKVYICDLAALQFQQPYNTGRLILIQEKEPYQAILDELIFEKVVGEKKRTFSHVLSLWNKDENEEFKKRYLLHRGFSSMQGQKSTFIDTKAYTSFVKLDVILSGISICKIVTTHYPGDKICFRFLKYGTGFFAGNFSDELDRLILPAVLDGMEELLQMHGVLDVIKCIEFPFYKCDPHSAKRCQNLSCKYKIEIKFVNSDALKQCAMEGVYVASTNCADNHAPCGNEMGFSSVDASIAENLESKGNIFCPNINLIMYEEYINL